MIKAIFLDFEGVITARWNILHGVIFKDLEGEITYEEMDQRYQLAKVGKITFAQFIKGIPKNKWKSFEKYVKYRKGSKSALVKLSKKYPLYIASNHIPGFFEREMWLLEAKKYFKKVFASHKMGLAKPNPEFYLAMLKKTGLKAEECLFVDDAKRNLEAAKKLGFVTVWMDNKSEDKRNNTPYLPDLTITDLRELEKSIK